ncbi:FecR family protein [Thermomonas flagellata]|uniref:FecR family protein n=1 Tax=Thermomonas flagellata TaxID=2888524 RepID=UPI001F03C869|nr:FecR domain-containing protein [Thermomonas flagellata]
MASPPTDTGAAARIEAAAAAWLARRDAGAWADADAAALEAWLAQDARHRVAFLRLQDAWQASDRLQALGAGWRGKGVPARGQWAAPPADRRAQLLAAVAMRPPSASPAGRGERRAWRALAAGLLGVAALLLLLLQPQAPAPRPPAPVVYASARGEVATHALADGSQATLAGASRIAVRYAPDRRAVTLERGEALFAVAKDPARPFVVSAGGYAVTAVGTRFAVRHDLPGTLRVVVTEGRVRLQAADPAQPSTLLPAGSVAEVEAGRVLLRSLPADAAARLLDWQQGWLVFADTPLAEAVAEFNRYAPQPLVLADPALATLRIGGRFRRDNQAGFVRLLEAGWPVRAERQGERILLYPR